MPAGRGIRAGIVAPAKLAMAAKAGALAAAIGLAGAGAVSLATLAPPSPAPTHVAAASGSAGVPSLGPPASSPGEPGRGRIAVPEPPSGALVVVAILCVFGLRRLVRRKSG